MRMLVVAAPGIGHLLPMLPLARAARDRGHDVRIASGSSLAPIAAAAGFPFVEAGPERMEVVGRAIPGLPQATGRRRAVLMVRHGFAERIAATQTAVLLAASSAWRPDLIVREDMAFAGWIVADRLGTPHATVQVTAWRPRVQDIAREPLAALRVAHGLPPDRDLAGLFGQVFFGTRPPSLQDPDAPLPVGAMPLRPIADDQVGAADPVDDLPDPGGRPRVVVTLGTVDSGQRPMLRALIEGATAAGAQVVVALGADPSTLGPIDPDVVVRAYLPLSVVLPTTDAVVFHGGSGTLTAALAAGRPLVITPIAADQLDNADRALAAGIARVVPLAEVEPKTVRDATTAVLHDPRYRERAEAVAAEIAAMPGPDRAVEHLESIVERRTA
jgi:UDP:flavonoid glycosyltransferase YjiC (YdhE family)